MRLGLAVSTLQRLLEDTMESLNVITQRYTDCSLQGTQRLKAMDKNLDYKPDPSTAR